MSQIKLRRDTYANFTASNPVLGSGEPAYETDTKKLKIGDGSTAYTQLDYFSSGGGGGSVDITATLPLKIDENGVISLEVDGQTIQIVDGKLHANTDELGNEVNDLSGRVTATEADILTIQGDVTDLSGQLDGKEDKITATEPLSLISSTLELNHGMTITSDNTGFYSSTACIPDNIGRYGSVYTTYDSNENNGPTKFYIIPYKLGQVVKFPILIDTEGMADHLFLANIDSSANVDFIGNTYSIANSSDNGFINKGATFSFSSSGSGHYTYKVDKFTFRGGAASSSKTPTGITASTGYSQIYMKDGALYAEKAIKRPDGVTYVNRVAYSEASHIERLSQINAMLIPQGTGKTGNTETNAMKFANYGLFSGLDGSGAEISLYDYTGDLSTAVESGENLWKPTETLTTNTLQLSIGDGLSVTDGKLTATAQTPSVATTSTAGIVKPDGTSITITEDGTISSTGGSSTPDNMVTTDTTQTITGIKSFPAYTLFDTTIQFTGTISRIQNIRGNNLFLDNADTNTIKIGESSRTTILSDTVQDSKGSKFLKQNNVTAGDNISIENTTDGIKISSTGGSTGNFITVPGTTYQDLPIPTAGVWYKSPGNGYMIARFMSSSANQFCQLGINSTGTGSLDDGSDYNSTLFSVGGSNGMSIALLISEDHYWACNWNFGQGCKYVRFIPLINK